LGALLLGRPESLAKALAVGGGFFMVIMMRNIERRLARRVPKQ
jgi:hypothetical protein